jgi:hypothetical protein
MQIQYFVIFVWPLYQGEVVKYRMTKQVQKCVISYCLRQKHVLIHDNWRSFITIIVCIALTITIW